MKTSIQILIFFLSLPVSIKAQSVPIYKNPKKPIEQRVADLLSRMTPEEKFWQLFMIPGDLGADETKYKNGLFGFQVSASSQGGDATSQLLNYKPEDDALALARKINHIQQYFVERTRLGIPIIAFDECLHGLVRKGATSFPQAIALAASFDTTLMRQVAGAIARETKSRGIRDVLSPVINIASDVRWGRTEETYGEDPFLTAAMAVSFVSPFENMGVITTPKHFIANVGDGGRDSYPIHYNERILDEVFFPPFVAAIKKGGARSIMTAYNSLDGTACSSNDWLLNQKLKKQWDFKGFVISDASAVGGATVLHNTANGYPSSGAQAITGGLDVIFQTDYNHHELFIPPFLNGEIDPKKIDEAVTRVLRAKFELGLFEAPYISEEEAKALSSLAEHKALAKKAAIESMVLLKNEKNILPLEKKYRQIALIGKDAEEARLGGYSGPSNGKLSILDGMKTLAAAEGISVNYAEGADRSDLQWITVPEKVLKTVAAGKTVAGLTGEYFDHQDFNGKPVLVRTDRNINFQWTLFSPDPKLQTDHYAIRWTGKMVAPETGKFKIGLEGNDGYRLYINGKLMVDQWLKQSYHTRLTDVEFIKGVEYDIRVEFHEASANAQIRLVWNLGLKNAYEQKINQAVKLAASSDIAVVVVGIKEGEFQDRALLNLPGHQEELIEKITATGKPVIVVLVGGSAITMNKWIDKVPGILDVWYPGEEGGSAVAEILFGKKNPAGRLPITFPISESQLPLVYNHKPTGRGDDYNNLTGQPLFPFGYGLSYTQFEYTQIELDKKTMQANDTATLSFQLTNNGNRDGEEVVQLYIRDLLASVARPVLELKGFQRVFLKAGESKKFSFKISAELLQMLDQQLKTVVEPGIFRLSIGSSSRDLWLKTDLEIK